MVMLSNKRAVFFDAGFTLLEPTVSVADVYMREARRLGAFVPEAEFRQRLTEVWADRVRNVKDVDEALVSSDEHERHGWRQLTWQLAQPFPQLADNHLAWLAALFDHFDSPQAWRPLPGALELLAALRQRGVAVAIVSNWHTVLHTLLAAHGVRNLCACVLTSAEIGFKKPHPRIFLEALRRTGVSAGEAVHVGDSWTEDIQGARAVGIDAIYVQHDTNRSPEFDYESDRGSGSLVGVVTSLKTLLPG
jgi:putative hydrolase of the HAD superfamily